jgi:hypothetical protein
MCLLWNKHTETSQYLLYWATKIQQNNMYSKQMRTMAYRYSACLLSHFMTYSLHLLLTHWMVSISWLTTGTEETFKYHQMVVKRWNSIHIFSVTVLITIKEKGLKKCTCYTQGRPRQNSVLRTTYSSQKMKRL